MGGIEKAAVRTQLKGILPSWLTLSPSHLSLQFAASRALKLICCDTFKSYNASRISSKETQLGCLLREQEVDWVGLAEPPSYAVQTAGSFMLKTSSTDLFPSQTLFARDKGCRSALGQ